MSASADPVLEFVVMQGGLAALGADWPVVAGAARRSVDGSAELVHFAPGRWLVVAPGAELRMRLDGLVASGAGVLIEVSGKWRVVSLTSADAARLLSADVALETVLQGRDCAALSLFDCPTVLVRSGDAFELYVHSSYVHSLLSCIERISASVAAT